MCTCTNVSRTTSLLSWDTLEESEESISMRALSPHSTCSLRWTRQCCSSRHMARSAAANSEELGWRSSCAKRPSTHCRYSNNDNADLKPHIYNVHVHKQLLSKNLHHKPGPKSSCTYFTITYTSPNTFSPADL